MWKRGDGDGSWLDWDDDINKCDSLFLNGVECSVLLSRVTAFCRGWRERDGV